MTLFDHLIVRSAEGVGPSQPEYAGRFMDDHCIPYSRLPGTSALFQDYVDHFERVAPFYGGGSPFALSSYFKVAGGLDYSAALRSEIVRILTAHNRPAGASEPTLANLRRLAEPGTLAVVTGQQAGLFSGPAFTLYKALTAIRMAQRLSEQGLPSVPIFWLATEDHDLEEVASTAVLDDSSNRVALSDPGLRPAPHSSVGYVQLTEAVTETLNRLRAALPAGEARDRLLADLSSAYQPGVRWGEAFARFMARIFGRWGVILLDALDPELHRLAARMYAHAVVEAPELNSALRRRAQALVEGGYHAQVHVGEDSTLLFVERQRSRLALRLADDGREFKLQGGERLAVDQIRHEAAEHPEGFTPNALFRPVVQDLLLPTVAYIAGPAELAYHAESAALYPNFGRPQPVVFPRASFTLVDPRCQRLLQQYKLSAADAWKGEDYLRQKLAGAGFSSGWQERLDRTGLEMARLLDGLAHDIGPIDSTLLPALERTRQRTLHQIERLKHKVAQAAFARSETLRRHESALGALLAPGGSLQERGLGGVHFLGRGGYELLAQLLDLIALDSAQHQVVPYRQAASWHG
ncbi:MAG TPA: bacillithiol biosynthesis cysteine-adding enzyme BshC [Terriglobia bacterium]|nr:bacillithiol biosynthesis cysteine-adding enzyme BshC [Terriglobia bacterium]